MAEEQADGRGAASRSEAGRDAGSGAPAGEPAGGPAPPSGEEAEGGHSAIGPEGAAPEWRGFYRAVRDAVLGMRPEK
ncbi:hypothetical protein SAMN02799624_03188 [Paenibacillus sp. UNC496MF]|uniref:hypothetical protein n=1 Tax=Paenibacillus sp. UNC496MF TaxID=1502753 RepID=UPI0008E90252|nr:hypothetical protein [Paenibacillus sp. UNC496MF]SFJ05176.1 hypothetical protein SAMN02799624_03188 [Paenibacillus sp. UNC496MF]